MPGKFIDGTQTRIRTATVGVIEERIDAIDYADQSILISNKGPGTVKVGTSDALIEPNSSRSYMLGAGEELVVSASEENTELAILEAKL